MRDPNPTVILIPGLGMIAWGKNKSESRVTAEFYNCAIEVMRGAEAIDEYERAAEQEAFDIEYWLLEEAKLQRMPPEKELARQVIAVVGAGSGIGKASRRMRLAKEGAHVVCVDRDEAGAQATAKEITDQLRRRASAWPAAASRNCGPAIGLAVRHHRPRERRARCSSRSRWPTAASTRWSSRPASSSRPTRPGASPTTSGRCTFAINVTGLYLVADEARSDLAGARACRPTWC